MNLSGDVDLEEYVARPDKISDADINAICQEAGMHVIRENRYIVLAKDFEKGIKTSRMELNISSTDKQFAGYFGALLKNQKNIFKCL